MLCESSRNSENLPQAASLAYFGNKIQHLVEINPLQVPYFYIRGLHFMFGRNFLLRRIIRRNGCSLCMRIRSSYIGFR